MYEIQRVKKLKLFLMQLQMRKRAYTHDDIYEADNDRFGDAPHLAKRPCNHQYDESRVLVTACNKSKAVSTYAMFGKDNVRGFAGIVSSFHRGLNEENKHDLPPEINKLLTINHAWYWQVEAIQLFKDVYTSGLPMVLFALHMGLGKTLTSIAAAICAKDGVYEFPESIPPIRNIFQSSLIQHIFNHKVESYHMYHRKHCTWHKQPGIICPICTLSENEIKAHCALGWFNICTTRKHYGQGPNETRNEFDLHRSSTTAAASANSPKQSGCDALKDDTFKVQDFYVGQDSSIHDWGLSHYDATVVALNRPKWIRTSNDHLFSTPLLTERARHGADIDVVPEPILIICEKSHCLVWLQELRRMTSGSVNVLNLTTRYEDPCSDSVRPLSLSSLTDLTYEKPQLTKTPDALKKRLMCSPQPDIILVSYNMIASQAFKTLYYHANAVASDPALFQLLKVINDPEDMDTALCRHLYGSVPYSEIPLEKMPRENDTEYVARSCAELELYSNFCREDSERPYSGADGVDLSAEWAKQMAQTYLSAREHGKRNRRPDLFNDNEGLGVSASMESSSNAWFEQDATLAAPKLRMTQVLIEKLGAASNAMARYDILAQELPRMCQMLMLEDCYRATKLTDLLYLRYSVVIVDEAHMLSNNKILRHKAVRALLANTKIMNSGTFIQNTLYDLRSMFQCCNFNHPIIVNNALFKAACDQRYMQQYKDTIERYRNARRKSIRSKIADRIHELYITQTMQNHGILDTEPVTDDVFLDWSSVVDEESSKCLENEIGNTAVTTFERLTHKEKKSLLDIALHKQDTWEARRIMILLGASSKRDMAVSKLTLQDANLCHYSGTGESRTVTPIDVLSTMLGKMMIRKQKDTLHKFLIDHKTQQVLSKRHKRNKLLLQTEPSAPIEPLELTADEKRDIEKRSQVFRVRLQMGFMLTFESKVYHSICCRVTNMIRNKQDKQTDFDALETTCSEIHDGNNEILFGNDTNGTSECSNSNDQPSVVVNPKEDTKLSVGPSFSRASIDLALIRLRQTCVHSGLPILSNEHANDFVACNSQSLRLLPDLFCRPLKRHSMLHGCALLVNINAQVMQRRYYNKESKRLEASPCQQWLAQTLGDAWLKDMLHDVDLKINSQFHNLSGASESDSNVACRQEMHRLLREDLVQLDDSLRQKDTKLEESTMVSLTSFLSMCVQCPATTYGKELSSFLPQRVFAEAGPVMAPSTKELILYQIFTNQYEPAFASKDAESIILPGDKIILFDQWPPALYMYARAAECAFGPNSYDFIHNKVDVKSRMKILQRFESDPNMRVLFMTIRTGAYSNNIPFAKFVMAMSPWWNPQILDQAIGRTDRPSRDHPIYAYIISITNSIEVYVMDRQEHKLQLATLLDHDPIINSLNITGKHNSIIEHASEVENLVDKTIENATMTTLTKSIDLKTCTYCPELQLLDDYPTKDSMDENETCKTSESLGKSSKVETPNSHSESNAYMPNQQLVSPHRSAHVEVERTNSVSDVSVARRPFRSRFSRKS